MELEGTRSGRLLLGFARAAATDDFEAAHQMLSPDLRQQITPSQLRLDYDAMVSIYDELSGNREVTDVHVESVDDMSQWASRKPHDVGWAYVAISGANWSEAVAGVVESSEDGDQIRELEWGRP